MELRQPQQPDPNPNLCFMPPLLRRDAIRLLEASLESLQLAISSLGAAKRVDFRQQSAEYSIEIGLIGAAAELGMSACLVQALGPASIVWPSGRYKTAGQVLDEFRSLVREAALNSEFITQGVDNPGQHRSALLGCTVQFRRLIPVRAGGLHAGRGLLHEATVVQATVVSEFLELLSKSSRISPYVQRIPRCRWYADDRTLIIEDLNRRLLNSSGDARAAALASLYLVLPDVPSEEPEWLEALERVAVAPKEGDVTYLMNALNTAVPANLRRVAGAGDVVPVVVRPGDPNAIPISPQHLSRQFNEMAELWHSDVATANGRLESGMLDLPPTNAVREVFALGLDRAGVLRDGDIFTAHQSWAAVTASLAQQGTPGPLWFLVRRTPDLGQLLAQLRRAGDLGTRSLRERVNGYSHGVRTIQEGQNLPRDDAYFGSVIKEITMAEEVRGGLWESFERNRDHARGLPGRYLDHLDAVAEGGDPVGSLLADLFDSEDLGRDCLRYWSRMLASAAIDADDLPTMVTMLARSDVAPEHTFARKAIRRIDFRLHGPPVSPA